MKTKYYIVPLLFVAIATVLSVVAIDKVMHRTTQQASIEVAEVEQHLISPYDKMFQDVGKEYGIDWLLLSAIACAESEFRFDAVSRAGAVGLMQIMPVTAKSMGYEREQLFNAEISAEVAAKLLHENNKMLHLPRNFDKEERLKFILACYNAGYSRIADARRLAHYYEDNADKWSVVATYLTLLSEPEYAEHEVVQSGEFYGSGETIDYVNKVLHIYRLYCSRIVLL
ncbi:MAG: transglycosylase [Rikenellaceae bacterium]|nr:transglycosylase [Rikenellaceae bacterium]